MAKKKEKDENWRKKNRSHEGSIKTIKGKLYARIQFIGEDGKRKEKLRPAESRRHARTVIKAMLQELNTHGEQALDMEKMTFKEFADIYEKKRIVEAVYVGERKVAGLRSTQGVKSALKALRAHFGNKAVRNIRPSDVEAYKIKRLQTPVIRVEKIKRKTEDGKKVVEITKVEKPRALATVNRELALLRTMFKFGERENLVTKNPFDKLAAIISLESEVKRDRVLSHDEEARLLAQCVGQREHLRGIVILALDSAMRKGEILKLCWRNVDFQNKTILVKAMNAKTMQERIFGMTDRVFNELSALWNKSPKDLDGLVFGITDFKHAWTTACEEAGIEGLVFHDLRHSATTRLVEAGVHSQIAMLITGHKNPITFRRYTNLTNDSVRRAADALAQFNAEREANLTVQENDLIN